MKLRRRDLLDLGAWATSAGIFPSARACPGSWLRGAEKPEGRIHFAGEHLSRFQGWMQGALESGLRAMQEVHAA